MKPNETRKNISYMVPMSWGKQAVLSALFTTGIGLFLTAIGVGGTLWQNLVISYCIGSTIHLLVSLTLFLMRGRSPFRHGVAVTATVAAGVLIGSWIGFAFLGLDPLLASHGMKDWQTTIIIGLTFGGIITWFFYSRVRMAQAESLAKEAELAQARHEKQRLEAELKLLQAQIEPHFLYNTLANIRSLVDTRPEAAAAMLEDLNKYLRTSLARSRDAHVTLGQEVDMLRAYLDILKVRMGDRMRYAIDMGEGLEDVPFPPMLLQPLVENAVKHGLEPKVEGGTINIKMNGNADILRVAVADTGMGLLSGNGEGVGLANVRSRLKSIYGDGARLEISAGPHGGVTAVIEVPRRK